MRTRIVEASLAVLCMTVLLAWSAAYAEEAAAPKPAEPAAEQPPAPAKSEPAATPEAAPQAAPAGESDAKYQEYLKKLKEEAEVRLQAQLRLSEDYFKAGQKRYEERRYEEAEQNFERALAANPNLAAARDYLDRVRRILGKTGGGEADILPNTIVQRQVEVGYQKASMLQTTAEARSLLNEGRYADALQKLTQAQSLAKVLAAQADISAELAEINSLIAQAQAAQKKAAEDAERQKLEAAKAIAQKEQSRQDDLQKQRVQRLFDDAKELYAQTRYLLAAKKAEEILRIEPLNKDVVAFRDVCYNKQVEVDLKEHAAALKRETDQTWRETRVLSIPFTQIQPLYPADWEEKKKRTQGIGEIEPVDESEKKWRQAIETVLDKEVTFDFIATPLDDVVSFFHNLMHVNIVLDKKALEGRNVDVTLRLEKVKFRDALEWILKLSDLRYTLDNGAVFISSKEQIAKTRKTVTRYYDVTDLTIDIKNFKPNLNAISSSDIIDPTEVNTDVRDIFSEDDGGGGDTQADVFTGDSLVEFIKTVIAPGTWDELVGGGGDLFK